MLDFVSVTVGVRESESADQIRTWEVSVVGTHITVSECRWSDHLWLTSILLWQDVVWAHTPWGWTMVLRLFIYLSIYSHTLDPGMSNLIQIPHTCLCAACLHMTQTPTSPSTTTPAQELCQREKCWWIRVRRRRHVGGVGPCCCTSQNMLNTCTQLYQICYSSEWYGANKGQQRLWNSKLVLYCFFTHLQQYFKCVFIFSRHG